MNIRGISVAAVTGYGDADSLIANNKITTFSALNPKTIVGIDIQGKTDSIILRNNQVDLADGVGKETDDEYIALRLRSFVNQAAVSIRMNSNSFSEEVQILTVDDTYEGPGGCPFKNNKVEWELGNTPGNCPFGQQKKVFSR